MEDRKVQVVLEDIRAQFRAFGEAQQGLVEKVDDIKKTVSQNTEDIKIIKTDVSILKTDVSVLKTDVAELKTESKKHTSDIGIIKTELKKVVRVDEFKALEKRVTPVERKLSQAHF